MEPSARWLSQGLGDLPAADDWLAPREAAYLSRKRFPKRRSEFRLGRWTAKCAIADWLGRGRSASEMSAILVDYAPDGAPAPFVDGQPAPVSLTMTDRADQAVCLIGPPGTALGCDLELVEPRSEGFVGDYLTTAEQRLVADAGEERDLVANLIWCGKESALKVLRTGLRRSTLSVEVSFPRRRRSTAGRRFACARSKARSSRATGSASARSCSRSARPRRFAPPRPFVDPPGLATATPGEAWRLDRVRRG